MTPSRPDLSCRYAKSLEQCQHAVRPECFKLSARTRCHLEFRVTCVFEVITVVTSGIRHRVLCQITIRFSVEFATSFLKVASFPVFYTEDGDGSLILKFLPLYKTIRLHISQYLYLHTQPKRFHLLWYTVIPRRLRGPYLDLVQCKSTTSPPVSVRSVLVLSSHLCIVIPVLSSLSFSHKKFYPLLTFSFPFDL